MSTAAIVDLLFLINPNWVVLKAGRALGHDVGSFLSKGIIESIVGSRCLFGGPQSCAVVAAEVAQLKGGLEGRSDLNRVDDRGVSDAHSWRICAGW